MYRPHGAPVTRFSERSIVTPVGRNRKSRKAKCEPGEYFCRTTGSHGFAHVTDSDELPWLRVVWAVVIMCFASLAVTLIYTSAVNLVNRTLTTEFLERIDNEDGQGVALPDIHICDASIFNATRLKEMGFDNTTATYLTLATSSNAARISLLNDTSLLMAMKDKFDLILAKGKWTMTNVIHRAAIKRGAKRSCIEKTGKTASDLARIKGYSQVADFIDAWDPLQRMAAATSESEATPPSTSNSSYFCDICQQTFQETNRITHCTSVVHQFNAKPEPAPTYYGIADSNRGFQMLLKSGWNREKGLGPEGAGLKFPTKTLLKRDRSGLGGKGKDTQLRVTHFAPYDTSAVAGRTRDKSKSVPPAANDKELRERERRKEIAWRRELS